MFSERKGWFGALCAVLLGSLMVTGVSAAAKDDAQFPLRAKYETVGVVPISTAQLAAHFNDYTIVDARSAYEYHTLHIKDAHSIPLASNSFDLDVKALAEKTGKPLVFYCNGITCEKSYRASVRAMQAGIKHVYVYDAGIFNWAEAHPDKTVLLGKPMHSADQLISKAEFNAHLLTPKAFYEQTLADPKAIILDIRDAAQRAGISLFQMRDIHVPLDNASLEKWVNKAKSENRALYFVDATGRQVRWLQYYLKEQGLTNYWFMKGGAKAFYATL